MSQCNYCSWMSMKRQGYKKATPAQRKKLWDDEVKANHGNEEDVLSFFGTNTGVVIVNSAGEFACWFMELPDRCCC